jgi:DNA-binding MarR family transcriptional regulator
VARTGSQKDAIDGVVSATAEIWPQADTLAHGAVARVSRVLSFIHTDLEAVAADFGISLAALEALAALRLAPPPHRLPQRALGELLMRTSGTLSVRLARLEQAGLISREPDPDDARGVIVQLTTRGRDLIDAAIAARLETESTLLSPLSAHEQEQLSGLLRKVLVSLEQREAGPHLGLEIATRRAARQLRSEHGIAEGVGLLVAAVVHGGLGDRAGIVSGDLILRLDGTQLRSGAQLRRGLFACAHGGELGLSVLRQGQELPITITVPSSDASVPTRDGKAARKASRAAPAAHAPRRARQR